MENRDSSFDGRFFVGVKTMKIYCLVSCKAKLPLHKNVEFFATISKAESAGYRACKRCNPDVYPSMSPVWFDECIRYLTTNIDRRVLEAELAVNVGVDVSTVRRHFKRTLNQTPANFHRHIRLKKAAQRLLEKAPVLQVSEESGYESLSGFVTAFRKKYGVSPGNYGNA